jgi:alpha-galactosidase
MKLLSLILLGISQSLNNGLGAAMGWNSWNRYGCNILNALIMKMADSLIASELPLNGYKYIVKA